MDSKKTSFVPVSPAHVVPGFPNARGQSGPIGSRRRQVPRRNFEAPCGILYRGEYLVERMFQVSEGGLMMGSTREMNEGDCVVVSFKVPTSPIFIVQAVIRSVVAGKAEFPHRYAVEFQTLEFSSKREIRNFVASATREDSHAL